MLQSMGSQRITWLSDWITTTKESPKMLKKVYWNSLFYSNSSHLFLYTYQIYTKYFLSYILLNTEQAKLPFKVCGVSRLCQGPGQYTCQTLWTTRSLLALLSSAHRESSQKWCRNWRELLYFNKSFLKKEKTGSGARFLPLGHCESLHLKAVFVLSQRD